MRHVITSFWTVLAVAGVLAIGSAFAQEPATTAIEPTNPGPSTQIPSQQVALPTILEKLNLSPQQQTQIQEIVRDYDTMSLPCGSNSVIVTWKRSGRRQSCCRPSRTT